jgi:protein arginine kinase activator
VGVSEPRCDQCGKQPAGVRYTEIDDGKVTRRRFCKACALRRGLVEETPKPVAVLPETLSLPTGAEVPEGEARSAGRELVCSACGFAFASFQQTGRLGCPECYATFRSQMVPLLRKLHGAVRHAGKSPRAFARKAELRQQVEDLRAELERAVRAEDYERAARLRDQMRAVAEEQSVAARRADDAESGSES